MAHDTAQVEAVMPFEITPPFGTAFRHGVLVVACEEGHVIRFHHGEHPAVC